MKDEPADGMRWHNAANRFGVGFADRAGASYVRLSVGSQRFDVSAVDAAGGAGVVAGSRITYPAAWPGADLQYDSGADGVKETIVLKDRTSAASFSFRIRALRGPRPTWHRLPDGSYGMRQAPIPGDVLVLQAPTAMDAAGSSREVAAPDPGARAQLKLTRDGASDVITVSVDRSWLDAPQRRFPVLLDPTITVQPDVQDASFPATCAGCTPFVSDRLYIGSDDANAWRGALQFDLAGVPSDAAVTGASLGLYFDGYCISATGPFCGGTSHTIEAHRMTRAWSTGSTTSQVSFDATALATYTLPAAAAQGWMSWPITSTVQGWLSGSQPNHGLLLKRDTEPASSSGPVPPGRSFTASPALQPKIDVTYTSDAVTLAAPDTVHSDGADLRWTRYAGPSGAPFSQYEVHRSTSSTFTPSAATRLTTITDPSIVAYRDTTARAGTQFTYKIVANAASSNGATVTTPGDGQARKTLQPDPAAGLDTYASYAAGITNCANYGKDTTMFLGADTGGTSRPLVKFSLAEIPAKARVTSASLDMWQLYSDPAAVTAQVHRVTRDWQPGTGTATCTGDGATWYDATGGTPWSTQGGDFDPAVAASVSKPANQPAGFDTFDISGLAQQWVDGTAPNLGLLVKLADETAVSGNSLAYASADYTGSPALRPRLTLDYTDGSHALAPSAVVGTPAAGSTVSGTTTIAAGASDDGAVDHVDLLVDGTSVATATSPPYSGQWNTTSAANGSHTIAARAVDNAGNTATSPGVRVTVDNTAPPTAAVSAPAANATVAGSVAVTAAAAASTPATVAKVDLFFDNRRFATATASPYTGTWNTLDPAQPAYDGAHQLTAQTTDSTGRVTASAPLTVTVANTAGTRYRAGYAPTAIPPAMEYDPALTTQPAYGVDVTVTNNSAISWKAGDQLNYRWISPDPAVPTVSGTAVAIGNGLRKGTSATVRLSVLPPSLPDGVNSSAFTLRIDAYDTVAATWFADKGNPPVSTGVTITRKTAIGLGLEKYYQYEGQPAGGGATALTNVASGNMLLRWTPFDEPGRGLASVLDLTYNSLEQRSQSPAGNNVSLALSSLTRLGTPIDFHPNNADTISGRSNKYAVVTDGDGTALRFTGTTTSSGTSWTPPPGVHLYLRTYSATDANKYWALSRPDKVTFFYTQDGFPTAVTDKNGNTLTFAETATPPGDDPGGQTQRVTSVTDAAGRAFTIGYYGKDETHKAGQRGKIKEISDHNGHVLHLDYYEDGNLLRIVQRGGTNADGSALADRTWILTYLTSNGAGPAIPLAADRAIPDPKTTNENSQVYSLRDPLGHETTFAYWQNSDGPFLAGRLKTRTDRAGAATGFAYDSATSTTTVTAPLSRTTKYGWDSAGRPVAITNPKNETTGIAWTADNQVKTVTEPNNAVRTYAYNTNGYLTDSTDQEGDHTQLAYTDKPLDSTDTGTHWSLLTSTTAPNGVATATVGDYQYTFTYDSAGNLTSTVEPGGHSTAYCYNLAVAPACNTANEAGSPGTLRSVTRPNGGVTAYSGYDGNGLPTTVTDPLGRTSRAAFAPDGLALWTQDPVHAGATGTDTRAYRTYFDYDAFRRLGRTSTPKSTTADRGNLVWTSTAYDANDNPINTQDAHYGVSDGKNGAITSYQYDPMDRLTIRTGPDTSADPAGERTKTVYDSAGRALSVTSPKGMLTASPEDYTTFYGYDGLDRVVQTTQKTVDGTGAITDTRTSWNCYDNTGNLTSTTAPNANLSTAPACPATTTPYTSKNTYDKAHRKTASTDMGGRTVSATYDPNGNTITATDAAGNVTTITYDQRDKPVKTIAPYVHGGRTTTTLTAYDGDGNRTSTVSPRAWDAAPDKNNITDYVTRYTYDQADQLVRTTLPADASTPAAYQHNSYDPNGRLAWTSLPVSVSDPALVSDGARTLTTWTDTGWIASSKDPATPRVRYDYSAQGWQSRRTPDLPDGSGPDLTKRTSTVYYADGKIKSTADQAGQQTTFAYDANGNPTYTTTAHGLTAPQETPIESFTDYTGYDQTAATHYRKTASSSFTTSRYAYDRDGNPIRREDNASETLASRTPATGTPTSWSFTQTAAPNITTMTYDAGDRLTTQDDLGKSSSCTGRQRTTTTFTPQGWIANRTTSRADGACAYTPKQTTDNTWNDNGTTKTVVVKNGAGTVLQTHTIGYEDAGVFMNGNRTFDAYALNGPGSTACTGSAASCTAAWSYDARDRLVSANDGHGGTHTYAFDQTNTLDSAIRAGNVTTETGPSGTTTNTYAGNQQTSSTRGGATAKFWYDTLGRLVCQTTNTGSLADCGATGTGSTVPASVLVANGYDYLDRLASTKTYNAGTATDTATYTYDALDRPSQEGETHNGGNVTARTTDFAYQGQSDLLVTETQRNTLSGTGGSNIETKTYSYDAYGHRTGMADTTTPTGGTASPITQYTYAYDPHGSTSLLVDESTGAAAASYSYTPYGNPDTTLSKGDTDQNAPLNPYRYTAKRYDSGSKTLDMGARRFNPDTGRFTSQDQYQGALDDLNLSIDPLGQNRYALAAGNPLSFIETDGHMLIADGGADGGTYTSPVPPAQPTRATSTGATPRPREHHGPSLRDVLHGTLDVAGLVPVFGEVADGANAAWYAAEGDKLNAGLSLAAMVPVAGWGATAAKVGIKGAQAAKVGIKGAQATKAGIKGARAAEAGSARFVAGGDGVVTDLVGKAPNAVSLGHYPEYVDLGARTGARTFSMSDEAWNAMSPGEQWIRNQRFLDRAIANGSEFRLATPLDAVRPGSFFERELQYLFKHGFGPSPDGRMLVPGAP